MKDNPLLVIVVMAIVAALVVVVTGHAVDGSNLLTALFGLMALAGGGHLANLTPGASDPKNAQAAQDAA